MVPEGFVGDAPDQDVKCQVCGKLWPADQSICADDGTWLHEQTIMEIKPRSKRESMATLEHGQRETTTRQGRYETPHSALPIRGASTESIAAQLAPLEGPTEIGPGMRIGEYEIEAKIGEGAMGAVYRAIHPAIGKHVAVKIMTPKVFGESESVKRFVQEARAVAAIEHIGIVDVFGFGRIPDGRTYLVMEWLEGKSLGARLLEGPLPWLDACEIIRQIARALEAAHAKNIVHRDLKPENVFLKNLEEEKPMVKLLDFGLAKSTNKDSDNLVARTRSGQMLGTPLYMSPEQCKAKNVDHRTDIYALGCMCYELLVGRTPFDADNVAELITAHLVGEPPRATKFKSDFPPDLDKLLYGMIQKDPDKRPPLGEIRRIIGMQLSRASGVVNPMTPVDGVASIPSYLAQGTPVPAPAALTSPDSPFAGAANPSLTDAEMSIRSKPPWYLIAAIVLFAGVIVALVVLR